MIDVIVLSSLFICSMLPPPVHKYETTTDAKEVSGEIPETLSAK